MTDYDAMAAMFRLADFHVVGAIGSAIATAAAGLWLLRRAGNRSVLRLDRFSDLSYDVLP